MTRSLALILALLAFQGPHYRVTRRVPIPGDGGWDYLSVDAVGRRLYVAHGTVVEVLDVDRDSLVGEIPNTPGVHGVAIARALGRGFTSNGRAGTVTVFDLGSLAPLAAIDVQGQNPDAIAYDSVSGRVFTFNGRSHDATAIDARGQTVIGHVVLDGKPEFAVSDGAGSIYVNIEDKSELSVLDTRTLTVRRTWPLAGCEEPSGLALDRVRHRLFSVCGNRVLVVSNADRAVVIATLPIGDHVDGVAFDQTAGLVFSSNGEGTLTVIAAQAGDHYSVVATVPTQVGARTLALDPLTHRIFVATAAFGAPPSPSPSPSPSPPASEATPRRRPPIIPGSFVLLEIAP